MEGEYHWKCFIEACRDRVPVSIGAFDAPLPSADTAEEHEVEAAPATVEE
jgi:hypothetical protein